MQPESVLKAVRENMPRYVDDLAHFIAIPSVSGEGRDQAPLQAAAEHTKKLFEEAGMDQVELLHVEGAPPYVFGEKIVDSNLPTLLLYAHYDVQPPMRAEIWETPAFEPTVRGGRIYGRGASDDKAGVCVHAATLDAYLKAGKTLPVNVKVFIEGEEEVGSPHMEECLRQYRQKLSCDAVAIMDGPNYDTGVPALSFSTRGIVVVEAEVRSLQSPVHSGMWGGPLPDPILALSRMITGMADKYGRCTLPGFQDSVLELTAKERSLLDKVPYSEEELRKQSGLVDGTGLMGHPDQSIAERLWTQPSFTVTTFEAGSREKAGNVVMDAAWARLTFRVVAGQDPAKIGQLVVDHLQANVPWALQIKVSCEAAAEAWKANVDTLYFNAARQAAKEGYGQEAYVIGCGGTLPLLPLLQKALPGADLLLVGLGDPYCKAHSENESQHLGDFEKAICAQACFFENVAANTELQQRALYR